MLNSRADELARLDELVALRNRRLSRPRELDEVDVSLTYSTPLGERWGQKVSIASHLGCEDRADTIIYTLKSMKEKLRSAFDYMISIDFELEAKTGDAFSPRDMAGRVFGSHLSDVTISPATSAQGECVNFTIHEKGVYRLDGINHLDYRVNAEQWYNS